MNDKYLPEHFKSDFWDLTRVGKKLYLQLERGNPKAIFEYATEEFAEANYMDLIGVIKEHKAFTSESAPKAVVTRESGCLLVWEYQNEEEWEESTDLLTISIPHLIVQWSGAGVTLNPRHVKIEDLKEKFGLSPENSNESGHSATIRVRAGALAKFQTLCHYATPRELCWHDGKRIEVRPRYADMYRVNPVEFNAVAKRNEELQEIALRELRRLSHCVLREWPTCSVSGELVALMLRPFDFKTTSVVHGALICRHCNKDYQP